MTSAIGAIYSAVEAMPILVDGSLPKVYGLTGIPNALPSANLPCRVLLDLSDAGQGQSMEFVTVNSGISGGGSLYVDWEINDLMLLLPKAQGIGIKQVSTTLVLYTGAYVDACCQYRNLVSTASNEASMTNLHIAPGVYEYPAESGSFYWGVMATLTIREIIS